MATPSKIKLVVSEEKEPKVKLKPGMKLEVIAVQLVDPDLNPAVVASKATLCGGDGCYAIVEL